MPRLALLLSLTLLAGCATMGSADPTLALNDPAVVSNTLPNGDVVSEYRVAGILRVVKIVPKSGLTYYLTDDDNDGRLDRRIGEGPISPVQYRIFSW